MPVSDNMQGLFWKSVNTVGSLKHLENKIFLYMNFGNSKICVNNAKIVFMSFETIFQVFPVRYKIRVKGVKYKL